MLNLASRQAQQITNTSATHQPISCNRRMSSKSVSAMPRTPQVKAKAAGAIPKLTMSASESNCLPNSLLVCVARATKPSKESKRMARPMAFAALSKSVPPPLSVAITA
jgi:hypothetical protein